MRGLIVACGVASAFVTMYAGRARDFELARVSSLASLVFVLLMVVFVVPPLLKSARAEAGRLNLPVRLTAGGALFLSLLAVVTFAAWNTGNNLLYLVFSILVATLLAAWIAGRAALRDLSVSARFADHIFAGEAAPALVTLANRKRFLPSFSVLIEAHTLEGEAAAMQQTKLQRFFAPSRVTKRTLAYFPYLPHRSNVEQRVEQLFARRGRVLVKGFEVSTRFPFGFLRLSRILRVRDAELVIYPTPAPVGDELHLLPFVGGRQTNPRRSSQGGHELHSLRGYQPQDDLRRIDWKASARARHLIVREFDAEDERRVRIALDTKAGALIEKKTGDEKTAASDDAKKVETQSAQTIETRFERGVTLAASLVAHFIEERAEVRLIIGGDEGEYGTGREHLYRCLRRLALAAPTLTSEAGAVSISQNAREESELLPRDTDQHSILLTMRPRGTLPAPVWRASHVIFL